MASESDGNIPNAPRPEAIVLCLDEAARDVVAYWLSAANVSTAVAADGYEAAGLVAPGVTRLFVTDRVLPPWPGLDSFRSLKAACTGLRVAVIEDGIPDSRIIARVSGADVLLAKPLRRAAVLEAAQAKASSAAE